MRVLPATLALAAAFAGGLLASPLLQHALPAAHAETNALLPAVYDLAGMQSGELPPTSNPEMRSKQLVVTDNATIALQIGNAPEHYHANTTEIQYIIEGSGQMWLGKERREIKPGTLIVIPAGTPHAGTIVSGDVPVKAIAIKIPPQNSADYVLVK
jgi:mannose-6-phosphate isomerase-like protein (cupin superfamily)